MKIEQLLGIDKATKNWKKNYQYAKQFYEENNHLQIPRDYVVDGYQVSRWVDYQKQRKKGVGKPLSQEQTEMLEAIEIVWEPFDAKWNKMYQYAKEYYEKFGHLRVPREYVFENEKLGYWVNLQRVSYKKGTLSANKIKLLEDIGMIWDLRKYNFVTRKINTRTKNEIKITLLKELKNILEENGKIENVEENFTKCLEL